MYLMPISLLAEEKKTRTKSEILALIKTAGSSKPDWWDSVKLNYPKSLDLSFKQPPKGSGWNTRKNVGQYVWSIINENSNKYKEGTKFIHYAMATKEGAINKDKYYGVLGHCYHDLLQDWARAAYWYKKCKKPNRLALANAYWQMGNKAMAVSVMGRIKVDQTRYGGYIKLWSDMGDLKKAQSLAKRSLKYSPYGGALKGMADALRFHGKYKLAITYYQKIIKMPMPKKRNNIVKQNKNHARNSIKSIKIFETFNLKKIKDGSYNSGCQGYSGEVKINVVVSGGKITNLKVTKHTEKQYYSSLVDIPTKIIEKQNIKKIDATTGATVTADAIINATAQALNQGKN